MLRPPVMELIDPWSGTGSALNKPTPAGGYGIMDLRLPAFGYGDPTAKSGREFVALLAPVGRSEAKGCLRPPHGGLRRHCWVGG